MTYFTKLQIGYHLWATYQLIENHVQHMQVLLDIMY